MAGNAYTIDKHPKKKAIVKDILRGVPDHTIALKYDISDMNVRRYLN